MSRNTNIIECWKAIIIRVDILLFQELSKTIKYECWSYISYVHRFACKGGTVEELMVLLNFLFE